MLDFFVAVPGAGGVERALRARPDPGLLHPGRRPQVFNIGAASCGVPGHAGRARARRSSASARCRSPSSRRRPRALAREGVEVEPRAGVLPRDPRADPDPLRGGGGRSTRPGASCSARATLPLPRARRRARAPRRRGRGAVLPRRGRRGDRPTGCSSAAARSAPADLAAYEPIAREPVDGALPRPRGAHQPAAVLGRDPDRLRARAARARRRRPDVEDDRRGDGGGAGGAHRGVPRRPLRGRASPSGRCPVARPARAGAIADDARLDHPHHRRRRRGALRQRHLLERHRLGADRARAPGCTSTTCSASRT